MKLLWLVVVDVCSWQVLEENPELFSNHEGVKNKHLQIRIGMKIILVGGYVSICYWWQVLEKMPIMVLQGWSKHWYDYYSSW